ncbi:hypothetical protein OHA40_02660 [Nocardia sp. NBC_00508]|uniref:hypothetical protein n=1 Tax=Nocardia sp. NBC_00508 TaxID=2975992 RepID=UPI002E81A039|nr:hypothetical protein [Nocardia sp. NBC_00508]WUD67081.1 hypothetical protein OHA40_02660 [Nocardia sp. NBC_00508]
MYAFASAEYLAALHGYLAARAKEFDRALHGAAFSVCEVYTDVPRTIAADGRVAVTWRVRAGAVELTRTESDDVELKVVVDWATIAPLAKFVVGDDKARARELNEAMDRAVADGKMMVHSSNRPPAFFRSVHDDMAALTL